jgi:hypothetical protein
LGNDITGDTAIFKQLKRGTVRDHITKLTAPAGIRVSGEVGDITRSGRNGICVGFFIVVGRKMVEGLNRGTSSRVIAETIFSHTVEVLEGV